MGKQILINTRVLEQHGISKELFKKIVEFYDLQFDVRAMRGNLDEQYVLAEISIFVAEHFQSRLTEAEKQLKALLTGLETQNIIDFMGRSDICDYKKYGEAYVKAVKKQLKDMGCCGNCASRTEVKFDDSHCTIGNYASMPNKWCKQWTPDNLTNNERKV